MTWYKSGTVSVTSGSNAVIGTGTSFIANSRVGDAFRGPDGGWYEVTNIASATALSIAPNYQGASVATGGYSLAPMQGYVKDSADALRAATQVIGQAGADATAQAQLATAAAASANTSKDAAKVSETNAKTSETNSATSRTNAVASAASAADSAASASSNRINAANSAASASNSATSAASSAAQAANSAASIGNKASSGANSDIKSLSGLTTPLSIPQGGTGANSATAARANLGVVAVTSNSDVTPGSFLIPGWMGLGSEIALPTMATFLANLPTGFYRCVGNATEGSPINMPNGGTVIAVRYSSTNTFYKVSFTSIGRFFEGWYNGTSVAWTEVGGAGAVSSYYESAATTWVANSDLVFTHNLGQPKTASFEAVLTAAVGSYPIGTRVDVPFYINGSTYWGAQIIGKTSTTITVRFATQLGLLQSSTGALIMTPTNSKIVARVMV